MKTSVKRLTRTSTKRQFDRPATMQVAAICYRHTEFAVEFLLVNTSAGKWTFPKGRIAPDMLPCQAAEQEALEEAGVTGVVEETCLGHYTDLKRALGHDNRSREILIAAYLLEVQSQFVPEEPGRNPTWFTPNEAKERLAEQRASRYSREITRIVEVAEVAVQRAAAKPEPSSLSPQEIALTSDNLDGADAS